MSTNVNTRRPRLTTRQARFVEEYCADFNATQAAIRAGYSAETARTIGSRLRTQPAVAAAIAEAVAALKARAEASADRWLMGRPRVVEAPVGNVGIPGTAPRPRSPKIAGG